MAIDLDDEILQDFLVEAGEIVELLGEQLVELEQSPDNLDLLNAIFRGFHTIKGGAGFLAIEPLVAVCHKAEDVFNILRQGDRKVTQNLMDVVLQVLDVVHEMFNRVRVGEDPEPANPELLEDLHAFASPQGFEEDAVQAKSDPESSNAQTGIIAPTNIADAVEQEFESMLEVNPDLNLGQTQTDSDEITEAEFDELLNALNGKGVPPRATQVNETPVPNASDDITDAEFDDFLDQLHGKGKFNPEVVKTAVPIGKKNTVVETAHQAKQSTAASIQDNSKSSSPSSTLSGTSKAIPKPEPSLHQPVQHGVSDDHMVDDINLKKATKATPPQAENTVRVDTQVLDDIMNMVGELVLVRNRFQTLKVSADVSEEMSKAVANLDLVTADLQLAVMKTRMQPIKKVFGRFPRVVRDLARSLNKEIRLDLIGEETDLDKNLVEALADPLVHLVRNAVDHGIETPEARVAAGKPREGVVVLKASQEGDHIQLSISDDGKGMNPEVLRKKVVEKGLMDEDSAVRLDRKECFNLIFMPGFSTKTEISDVSGRGVGMDVVKTRINQMNGMVEVDSEEGVGSRIIIKVPLTLAIMPTLMVKLGHQAFALPLASVLEILDLDLNHTNVVDGQLVIMVRQKALPIFYLSDWLINDPNYTNDKKRMGHIVVVNAGGRQVGFVVDHLVGQEEVVIKALGAKLQGLDGLSGATITGDGKIALILDVPGLMKRYVN